MMIINCTFVQCMEAVDVSAKKELRSKGWQWMRNIIHGEEQCLCPRHKIEQIFGQIPIVAFKRDVSNN